MRQKSILFGVTSGLSRGLLGDLPAYMAKHDWQVGVVSGEGSPWGVHFPQPIKDHTIPMVRTPSLIKDLKSLAAWLTVIRKSRPHVVSVGTPKAAFLGLLAARILRVPHRVYVLRGLRLETSTGLQRWILYSLERLTAINSTKIIAVSKSLMALYIDLGICELEKISVVGLGSSHGVDTTKFHPRDAEGSLAGRETAPPGILNNAVLGFVGRFCEDKGATTLLSTKRYLFERGIDAEFRIVGPVEDSSNILKKMESFGCGVALLGHVDNVEEHYRHFDLLLLPSRREGFPNCVLEASASGVPTVASRATGTVDAIEHNSTGLLATPGDEAGFARLVEELLLNPSTRERMGGAARAWAMRNFTSEKVDQGHLSYYNDLVATDVPHAGVERT